MNEITALVTKVTSGIKSSEKAREAVSKFFEEHDYVTNCKFIDALKDFLHTNNIGRRSWKKIDAVQKEIIKYLSSPEVVEIPDIEEVYEEYDELVGEYEHSVRETVKNFIEQGVDIPLELIPQFNVAPTMFLLLTKSGIRTINQLLECEQHELLELFKYNEETLSDLFLLLEPTGLKLNIPRG